MCSRVRPPPGAAGVADVLGRLTQRVDLVQMAVRGGAADSLPPDLDTAQQLLIVNDFPHGFDDRAVTQLRYLADEGPAVGVHLMMVADREDAAGYGPLLDPLWRSLLRLTPVPDDHLADPWVGHAWTYEPSVVPQGQPGAPAGAQPGRGGPPLTEPLTSAGASPSIRKASELRTWIFFYQSLYLSLVIEVLFSQRRGVLPTCCGVPVNTDQSRSRGVGRGPGREKEPGVRVEETSGSDDAEICRYVLPEAQ